MCQIVSERLFHIKASTDKGMIKACVDMLAALHNIFILIF